MKKNFEVYSIEQVKNHLIRGRSFIDVRAPVEFQAGAIPGSVNLPILDNDERALVGTCYKNKGQEKAIQLGHEIVSGENKRRKIEHWQNFLMKNPEAIVTCYRGGSRSQITQEFLHEVGCQTVRVENGYKSVRQYLVDELKKYAHSKKMLLLSGLTGSAKTHLLKKIQNIYPAIDLENLAQHRGSAFGQMVQPQPAQATFENQLATEILKIQGKDETRAILYEDESRLIGRVYLTDEFFQNLRQSSVILVTQTLEERIENIFKDYILDVEISEKLFLQYEGSLAKITKKLGSEKTKEIAQDLQKSKQEFLQHQDLRSNKVWIEKLLVSYYDLQYQYSFDRRSPHIIFKGTHSEILNFLKSFS